MQIGNTKYNVTTGSWNLKTPGTIKFICDVLLLISLIITVFWPEVDLAIKIGVAIKLLSNFISEHTPQEVQDTIADNPQTNV